jgi:hypothetical protein
VCRIRELVVQGNNHGLCVQLSDATMKDVIEFVCKLVAFVSVLVVTGYHNYHVPHVQ